MALSAKTIKNYELRIKKLNLTEAMLNDLNELIKQVQHISDNIGTQKNYYSAILWYIKQHSINTPISEELSKEIKNISHKQENERSKNKIPEKQKNVFVKWDEIIKLRDKLKDNITKHNYPFYVFLCLFTYQPVRRLEDTTLYYFKRKPSINDKNYIIINDNSGYVIYNVYKTSHVYGKQRYKLSQSLYDIVKKYIADQQIQENTPLFGYTISNSFGKYLTTMFQHELNKPITINTLRHSFITNLNTGKISLKTKEKIANKMGHTYTEQGKYSYHMDV